MRKRSVPLTVWLSILLLYNGVQAIQWASVCALMAWADQNVDYESEEAKAAIDESGLTAEELESSVSLAITWSATYATIRLASTGFLGWVFAWKKPAFWGYCVSVAAVVSVNFWGGESVVVTGVDLVALGVLVALLHRAEPVAWPQLE